MEEPMEEDDSFNDPIIRSVPLNRPSFVPPPPSLLQKQKDPESDPDSDDSFETFAPTQTTNGGSMKSSSSSTQSTDPKAPPIPAPFRPQPVTTLSSKQLPPSLQRSTCTSHGPPRPSTKGMGIHSAVTNTKNGEVTMTQNAPSSQGAPSSPNSLARHRSANSGLRSSQYISPRPGGMMFSVRTIPPLFDSQSSRPVTPNGDIKMLKDQLDNERRKMLRLQSEYQKDTQKKEEEHQKHLAARDSIIDRQKKDIELLKASIACNKKTEMSLGPTPPSGSSSTSISTTSDVKKVYPKIPSSESKTKTPRRTLGQQGHISAFRHPFKEELDDTFELNATFEPSATSTPRFSGLVRTGIRRPLDLDADDDPNENACGAPTPKRKPVFKEQRPKRIREEEVDDGIRIDPEIQIDPPKTSEKEEESPDGWIDRMLTRKFKILEFRRKNIPEKLTARARNRILKGAELRKEPPKTKCENCGMDEKIGSLSPSPSPEEKEEKEWKKREKERMEDEKKKAKEMRNLEYSTASHLISKRGIDGIDEMRKRIQEAEDKFQKTIDSLTCRNLEEIREEKRQEWRRKTMENLEENGELYANLEIKETGRNDDSIWTEDDSDEDFMFPQPRNEFLKIE
uniref:BMERB domain-containing protein n=1 Tax=Caenorhabditis tropicalis TaxID=1561998 RepID=A0A1I7ULU0_9PELO